MRTFEESFLIGMPAEEFWALRLDTNYDRFCASEEKCTFTLHSLDHGTDDDGCPTVSCESEITADESPLPSAVQVLLGARKFAFVTKQHWWPGLHDQAHAATFDSSPRPMGQRVALHGKTWVEAVSPTSCRAFYRVDIVVKLVGFSHLLEQGLEKRIKTSYSKLSTLTLAYAKTRECQQFLSSRRGQLQVVLDAPRRIADDSGSHPCADENRSPARAHSLGPCKPSLSSPVSPRPRPWGQPSPNSRPPSWRLPLSAESAQRGDASSDGASTRTTCAAPSGHSCAQDGARHAEGARGLPVQQPMATRSCTPAGSQGDVGDAPSAHAEEGATEGATEGAAEGATEGATEGHSTRTAAARSGSTPRGHRQRSRDGARAPLLRCSRLCEARCFHALSIPCSPPLVRLADADASAAEPAEPGALGDPARPAPPPPPPPPAGLAPPPWRLSHPSIDCMSETGVGRGCAGRRFSKALTARRRASSSSERVDTFALRIESR